MGERFHISLRRHGHVIFGGVRSGSLKTHTRSDYHIGRVDVVHHRHASSHGNIFQRCVKGIFQSLQLAALSDAAPQFIFDGLGQHPDIGAPRHSKVKDWIRPFPVTVVNGNPQRFHLVFCLGRHALGFHRTLQVYIGGRVVIQNAQRSRNKGIV